MGPGGPAGQGGVHGGVHGGVGSPYPLRVSSPLTPPRAQEPVDWPWLEAELAWLQALAECPQEPRHHGEGDVLAHTKLVVEALLADGRYQHLRPESQQELYTAALLHDVGKPAMTREEDGHIISPGHSRKGAVLARRILWEAGVAPAERERVCAIIRNHMVPFFLVTNSPADAQRRAIEISLLTRCDHLALQATADARGRISKTNHELEENVELFTAYCEELGVSQSTYPFASDHSRFLFFRRDDRDPAYAAYDDTRSRVTMMSGLPGSGKDTWLEKHHPDLPVVSLDAIRKEIKVPATENQGPVLQVAKERAREHLRVGRDFAWNATNISRRHREQQLALFAAYNAHVRIVAIEVAASRHDEQNRSRGFDKAVPEAAIERMLDNWEAPDLTECHELLVVEKI
jgi:predicted kinase